MPQLTRTRSGPIPRRFSVLGGHTGVDRDRGPGDERLDAAEAYRRVRQPHRAELGFGGLLAAVQPQAQHAAEPREQLRSVHMVG